METDWLETCVNDGGVSSMSAYVTPTTKMSVALSPAAVVLDGADINGDGEVNILDVVALVNIILSN